MLLEGDVRIRLKSQNEWHEIETRRLPLRLIHGLFWQMREFAREPPSEEECEASDYVLEVEDGRFARRIAFNEDEEDSVDLCDLVHETLKLLRK